MYVLYVINVRVRCEDGDIVNLGKLIEKVRRHWKLHLGGIVELGEAGLELGLPTSGHYELGQDGDVSIRAPGIFNLCINVKTFSVSNLPIF